MKKKSKVTISLPYPYTQIEFMTEKVFEAWVVQFEPDVQAELRKKWEEGRKFLGLKD